MEKHLTKKLKAKDGKLGGLDDGIDDLMDSICSYSNFIEAEPEVQGNNNQGILHLSRSNH